jgi:hypothetical protein
VNLTCLLLNKLTLISTLRDCSSDSVARYFKRKSIGSVLTVEYNTKHLTLLVWLGQHCNVKKVEHVVESGFLGSDPDQNQKLLCIMNTDHNTST